MIKAQTPNIDKLIKEGIVSYKAQSGDITYSGPGWSSMLTGVWRDKHGVTTNKFEAQQLQEPNLDVLFLHFDDVDHAGHDHGFDPEIPIYIKTIEKTDALVGQVIQTLKKRNNCKNEDWLIIVSTDHGGSGTNHGDDTPLHRTIFVLVSGPSARRGNFEKPIFIVDIAATALAHLEVSIDPNWGLDGHPVGILEHPGKKE